MEKKLLGTKGALRWSINKVSMSVLGMVAIALMVGIIILGWDYFNTEELVELPVVDLEGIDTSVFPQPMILHGKTPIVVLNGVNVANMTRGQQRAAILAELEQLKEETLTATYAEQVLTTTLADLGLQFRDDLETMLNNLEAHIYEAEERTHINALLPFVFDVEYVFNEEDVDAWIGSIASQLNVAPVEPGLKMNGRGNFNITEGRDGSRIVVNQLRADVTATSQQLTRSNLNVNVNMEVAHPTRSANALASVDTMIATAESFFDRSQTGRATNVDRGAELISGAVIMPGELFSFNNLVYPVTPDNGFRKGTIFMQGRVSEDIGGGLCQVSSTLYWAQLRTGIRPTWRQAHSLPVGYVPGGLDATMFIGLIDYQFINTLDYPLYLHAYTQGGTLKIEFWSNSEALDGKRFEPRSARVSTTATHTSYDTFMRTYDANSNQLLSEEFLHRSTYGVH